MFLLPTGMVELLSGSAGCSEHARRSYYIIRPVAKNCTPVLIRIMFSREMLYQCAYNVGECRLSLSRGGDFERPPISGCRDAPVSETPFVPRAQRVLNLQAMQSVSGRATLRPQACRSQSSAFVLSPGAGGDSFGTWSDL